MVHAVFEDYYRRSLLGETVKRVTKKVLESWESQLDALYQKELPTILKQYA